MEYFLNRKFSEPQWKSRDINFYNIPNTIRFKLFMFISQLREFTHKSKLKPGTVEKNSSLTIGLRQESNPGHLTGEVADKKNMHKRRVRKRTDSYDCSVTLLRKQTKICMDGNNTMEFTIVKLRGHHHVICSYLFIYLLKLYLFTLTPSAIADFQGGRANKKKTIYINTNKDSKQVRY